MRRLLRLRLALVEFSLAVLEEHCNEKKQQALVWEGKTSAEIALEEFTQHTPEPSSVEQVRQYTSKIGSNKKIYLDRLKSNALRALH